MSEITREQVKDFLSKLTVLEIAQLTKELEELWGVTAAAPMAMAVAAAPAAAAEVKEEQTEFDVILEGFDADKKVAVIKEMRTVLPALGLKESKELVESAPKTIKEAVSKAEAEEIKKKLEAVGGKVKVQ
ncbi:MAG TPA: 50S ribosomal protein L7/L12 [Myxococcota bacterium]|jgi:large subunit ribosomal protein L7/L12|nr:50S ribosomal protein L7/L12 [Myxococcota bacterium]